MKTSNQRYWARRGAMEKARTTKGKKTSTPTQPLPFQQLLLNSYMRALSAGTACGECGQFPRLVQTPGSNTPRLTRPVQFRPASGPSRLGHWIRKGVSLERLQLYLATCAAICTSCLRKGIRP